MLSDFYTILTLFSLWVLIALFCWQYREYCALQKREKRLERKNAEMTCFVYGAAHDLKAPLRAIMQISDHLSHDLNDTLHKEHKEDIELLRQRARRMGVLIDDLLAYWKAGQTISYAHNYMVDADELVREIIATLSPSNNFYFVVDPALKVMRVHHMPIYQVFMNLIGNAVKHHGGLRGEIRITGADEGDCYKFSVIDDGQGIPDVYKQKIFQPFETLRSRDEVEGSARKW